MAFVNAETLRRIFGGAPVMQQGAFDPSTPQGQQMIAMLAGAGSGMTQASAQPGANFAQALGGGAGGMMQGQHQHQQRQYMQQQIELQRQKMEEQRQRAKGWQEILYGPQGDFASQVDTGGVPSQQTALSGATITPEAQRGAVVAQQMPPQDVPIGTLGSMFESNGRADAINTGRGDPGGASYGRYQLASRTGTLNSFFESEEGQPFRTQFGDLEPGTPQFDQVWQEVANDPQVGPLFDQAQQQYMERTHFRPNLERAQRSGFDVSNPGVREAVVSMGTQHSPAGNLRIFNEAAARIGPDATPQQMVDALYEARTNYVRNLPEGEGRMSPDVKAGVLSRYERERAAAQQLTQVGLPQPAQQVLGGQQAPQQAPQIERSGYEQAGGGGGLNIPDEVRPLLALLGPEKGAQLLAQQAFASPADQPARVREAQIIAQQTGRPVGEVLAEMRGLGEYAQGPQPSAAEAEIGRLRSIGLSEEQAIKYQSGLLDAQVNEVTGRIVLTDMSNPDRPVVTEIPIAAPSGVTEGETPRESLYEAAEGRLSTGVWGAIQEGLGRTVGQLPVGGIGEEATEVRQQLRTAQNDIIRALSINPRFPVAEMERIRREIDISPSLFDSPESLQARMRSVDSSLRTRLATERRVANDPNRSPAQREAADAAIGHIEAFLRVLGVPQEGETLGRGPGAESGLTAPPGWEDDWDYLTPEEQQSLLQQSGGN